MFSYNLPNGYPNIRVRLDAAKKVHFGESLRKQSYSTVISILEDPRWSSHFKKIIHFGCGEMRLFKLIRRLDAVELIQNIDINELTLVSNTSRIQPLVSDHLKERDRPLRAEVLNGNIINAVENLRHADAVVALEVIEHLTTEELEKAAENLFGFVQPKLLILSTANRDFNVVLNGINESGMRSIHHKFEWNRKEFRAWANTICKKYTNYAFAILGIGPAPPSRAKLGTAIQVAIFARNDIIDRTLTSPVKTNLKADERPEVQYKELYAVDFPFRIDNRTIDEKIKNEIMNYLSYAHKVERFYNRERCIYQIPTKPLMEFAEKVDATEMDVLNALHGENFIVENEFILLTEDRIEELFNRRGDDMYEELDEDFLEFEPYNRSFRDDDDIASLMSSSCSIADPNDGGEEENWD